MGVEILGFGGAGVRLAGAPLADWSSDDPGTLGIDVTLATASQDLRYRRIPINDDFARRLATFLWEAADGPSSSQPLPEFEDDRSGLSLRVAERDDFTLVLQAELIVGSKDGEAEVEGLEFRTTRAALVTAHLEAGELEDPDSPGNFSGPAAEAGLPLDFFFTEGNRLTGIFRSEQRHALDDDEALYTAHLIHPLGSPQADVLSSCLLARLPFTSAVVHGVNSQGAPWIIVMQVLPSWAPIMIGPHWNPLRVARQEVNTVVAWMDCEVEGEFAAGRDELVSLVVERGVDERLITDWSIHQLVLAGVAELANAPLPQLAIGHLTGCAFPELNHDCPKDVFDCTFGRWQEMRLVHPPEAP